MKEGGREEEFKIKTLLVMGASRRLLLLEYNAFLHLSLKNRVCPPTHMPSLHLNKVREASENHLDKSTCLELVS